VAELGNRVTYRTRSIQVVFWGAAALCLLVAVDGFLGSSALRGAGLGGLVMALLAGRLAMTALIVDDRGLRVRGVFRTVAVAWDEIEGFSIGRWRFLGCVLLVHRGGRQPLPVVAVEGVTGEAARKSSLHAQAVADGLSARLTQITGRTGGRSAARRQAPSGS
jgi:Bacterial PH domain